MPQYQRQDLDYFVVISSMIFVRDDIVDVV